MSESEKENQHIEEKKVEVSKKDENVQVITLNIQPFLVPVSILLSSLIISVSIFAGFNKITTNGITGLSTTTSSSSVAAQTSSTATTTAATTVTQAKVKSLFDNTHIQFGDSSKKLLIAEFSDPSCPYCHLAGGVDPELNKQVGTSFLLPSQGGTYIAPVPEIRKLVDAGQASYVLVYLNGHGNGQVGMQALYCAFDQGKFWEAHDILMSNAGYNMQNTTVQNDKTKEQPMIDLLKGVLDATALKTCIDSGKYDSRLTSEISLSGTFGVQGTPGFYLNTTNFAGAYSWTDMKSAANTALNS